MANQNQERIFGLTWDEIQSLQQRGRRESIDLFTDGDYGADPLGDGNFRMVPSGDVVDWDERCRRLSRA